MKLRDIFNPAYADREITLREAGHIMRYADSGMYRLVAEGHLPTVKRGGRTSYVRVGALADFIEARGVGGRGDWRRAA